MILFFYPVVHTLLVVLIVSPIKENYGLWYPITPIIHFPVCIPIFREKSKFLLLLCYSIIFIIASDKSKILLAGSYYLRN